MIRFTSRPWRSGLAGLLTLLVAVLVPFTSPAAAAGATVTGVVSDASAAPVLGAEVMIDVDGVRTRTTTAADGSYAFADIPAGTWTVVVTHADYLRSSASVSVGADGTTLVHDVTLTRLGSVLVEVTSLTGPMPDRFGFAYVNDETDTLDFPTTTKVADGLYRISRLHPGTYHLRPYSSAPPPTRGSLWGGTEFDVTSLGHDRVPRPTVHGRGQHRHVCDQRARGLHRTDLRHPPAQRHAGRHDGHRDLGRILHPGGAPADRPGHELITASTPRARTPRQFVSAACSCSAKHALVSPASI